jgi:hypothetical protein
MIQLKVTFQLRYQVGTGTSLIAPASAASSRLLNQRLRCREQGGLPTFFNPLQPFVFNLPQPSPTLSLRPSPTLSNPLRPFRDMQQKKSSAEWPLLKSTFGQRPKAAGLGGFAIYNKTIVF